MTLDSPAARSDFILRHTRLLSVPHAPELRLHVADEATALWQKTEDELGAIGLPPPFWAFAWAGGQAIARYVLDNPALVRGRSVLDFAAGSGLCGIAAAQAGAGRVAARDIDSFAADAMALNAAANGVALAVAIADPIGTDEGWEVVLAGDVSYERDMAAAATDWLEGLARRGAMVLIGDPGRSYLARDRLEKVITYQVPVLRSLEDVESKITSVWRFAAAGPRHA